MIKLYNMHTSIISVSTHINAHTQKEKRGEKEKMKKFFKAPSNV